MCNPRRVRVSATRQLNEAWQEEISRVVELSGCAVGEACVRQPIGCSLSDRVIKLLEVSLANSESGWEKVEEGYRFNVDGGYVTYLTDEQELEISSILETDVNVQEVETQRKDVVLNKNISSNAEGRYYDDGWGGQTKEAGEKKAKIEADRMLETMRQEEIKKAKEEVVERSSTEIEEVARKKAKDRLNRIIEEKQKELEMNARKHLDSVGLRARQAFNRALANVYKDVIMEYATTKGAYGLNCNENDDSIDIEFCFSE